MGARRREFLRLVVLLAKQKKTKEKGSLRRLSLFFLL
jgi:hypothetical protein